MRYRNGVRPPAKSGRRSRLRAASLNLFSKNVLGCVATYELTPVLNGSKVRHSFGGGAPNARFESWAETPACNTSSPIELIFRYLHYTTTQTKESTMPDEETTIHAIKTASDGTVKISIEKYNELLQKAATKPQVINRTNVIKTTEMLAQENRVWGNTLIGVGASLFLVGIFRRKAAN